MACESESNAKMALLPRLRNGSAMQQHNQSIMMCETTNELTQQENSKHCGSFLHQQTGQHHALLAQRMTDSCVMDTCLVLWHLP